jgi:hypothetical protein
MFSSETIDAGKLREDLDEINSWDVVVDHVALEFIIRRRVERTMSALLEEPVNNEYLSEVVLLIEAMALLPVEVNLWQTQNMYWTMLQSTDAELCSSAEDASGLTCWSAAVRNLGQLLFFNVPAVLASAKGEL